MAVINKLEIILMDVATTIIYFPLHHSPKHSEKN